MYCSLSYEHTGRIGFGAVCQDKNNIVRRKRSLKNRFNEHRRTVDNPNSKSSPTTAAKHFLLTPNHSSNDVQLLPIEKILSNRDLARKAWKAHLIFKANTLEPYGLNIKEDLQLSHFLLFFSLVLSFFILYNLQLICYLHAILYFVYCFSTV